MSTQQLAAHFWKFAYILCQRIERSSFLNTELMSMKHLIVQADVHRYSIEKIWFAFLGALQVAYWSLTR